MRDDAPTFEQLGLASSVLSAVKQIGYETPSPIQEQIIPHVLSGVDVLGQAQTGTGKTAAFALPVLSTIDRQCQQPQCLVLAPTRELAIQVAEAFQKYAMHIKDFHVLPIYGGQDYRGQIRALKRGVHVVVGTPGRVMDHMRRGTLVLNSLRTIVLDEADEMLRMGFIDDIEWVMEHVPDQAQVALFSATMPKPIRRIAQTYLKDAVEVTVKQKTATAEKVRQRYLLIGNHQKLDALTRLLETEAFDGMIIFVRTKTATVELAERLEARGYAAAALNGDIPQNQRERTVDQLKASKMDILVATDVVARGLDVERISHVINYDIPYDTEAYVHRIGRTGRAGREGDAILLITPREKRLLGMIERDTKQKIELMQPPSAELVNTTRISRFHQRILDTIEQQDLSFYEELLNSLCQEKDISYQLVAAALAHMQQGEEPLLVKGDLEQVRDRGDRNKDRRERSRDKRGERGDRGDRGDRGPKRSRPAEEGMERYRVEVGHSHGVKPGNIVGAIANEADIESKYIGRIDIFDDHSTVDLPEGMPKETFQSLKKAWVSGQRLNISKLGEKSDKGNRRGKTSSEPRKAKKKKTKE